MDPWQIGLLLLGVTATVFVGISLIPIDGDDPDDNPEDKEQ